MIASDLEMNRLIPREVTVTMLTVDRHRQSWVSRVLVTEHFIYTYHLGFRTTGFLKPGAE